MKRLTLRMDLKQLLLYHVICFQSCGVSIIYGNVYKATGPLSPVYLQVYAEKPYK